MRKTAITILLMMAALCGYAQSAYDGLLFSENNYEGTARSVAMGNAFTALGGDLGSITINPAGSAVAGYSQFTITPGITLSASTSQGVSPYADGTLPYFERKMKSSMTSFNVPNMGMTINWDTNRNSGLKNMTFGFVVNKTASFDQNVYANGINSTTSFMGAMAVAADGYLDTDLNSSDAYYNYPWSSVVAYQSGMIGTYGEFNDRYVGASELVFDNGDIVVGGDLDQTYGRQVSGGKYDYAFNIGANISDLLYIGANLGMISLDYHYDEYFKEKALDPNDFEIALNNGKYMYFSQMKYNFRYEADGSGAYAKLGAILTPGFGLRIGAAIQTPEVNSIIERWQYTGSTEFTPSSYDGYAYSPEGEYRYTVISPFRANIGLAYTFGAVGIVSADYEYCDYSQMQFSADGDEQDYFDEVNSVIKEVFGPQHMLRLGAELKIGKAAIRGGYGLTTSPEKNFNGLYRSNFSFGLGYSSKGSFFADFAVRMNTYNSEYYMPYSDYIFDDEDNILEPAPELLITRSDWKALLTLGWRF
ncbi:MAG: hypothetical protein IKY66_09130 [Bacteroidales bacterium]|nr:hypothetical protein [Bacteroidales bacterium]